MRPRALERRLRASPPPHSWPPCRTDDCKRPDPLAAAKLLRCGPERSGLRRLRLVLAMTQDRHQKGRAVVPRTLDGSNFDRRKFLKRAALAGGAVWAAPAVTTLGVSRATATPCGGLAPAAPGPDPAVSADASAQLAARSPVTHTPCYQSCMEQRANSEFQAQRSFFSAADAALGDPGQLNACANRFRADIKQAMNDFRGCSRRCT